MRRLLAVVTAGLAGSAAAVFVQPATATATLPAPKSLSVVRAADDVHQIVVSWKPVADADHQVLDIIADDVETVIDLPARASTYTIDAPNQCTSYKVRIGAADATGTATNTGYYTLRALTPSAVMGLAPGREDEGTVAVASWRVPAWAGYTPLTGYRVVFTRLSDGVVLSDRTSTDMSFRYAGVDPARAYTLAVSAVNEFGSCVTAKSLLDRFRPADPTNLVVERRADAPGSVGVSWKAPATGPTPTYYQINYGQTKTTGSLRVEAPTTATTIPLAVDKAWFVEVKAYNENGGSGAVSGSVPVWEPAPTTPAPPTSTSPAPAPSGSTTPPADSTPAPAPTSSPGTDTGVIPSESSTVVDSGPDRTPPTITWTLSDKPSNGWFRKPVTIHFACSDTGGAVAVCPADIPATTDGAAVRYSGTAKDAAGNSTTTTLTLKMDQTAPAIAVTVLGTKNASGWYTTAPVLRYTCSDATSLISTCPADTPIRADGLDQKIIGTAYDKAGNTATAAVVLSIDLTAPAITAAVAGDTNADGWYTTAPVVRFTCADKASGIAECPADRTVSTEGLNQQVEGATSDRAGNTAGTTLALNIDRSAPVITATVVGEADESGWYRTPPIVHFTCTDAVSGVAECPADIPVGEGAAQVLSGTARDKAGNTATTSVTVDVDRTAPAITATVVGTPGASGWYTTTPTVHFTCTDEGSGIASCPADTPITTDGAEQDVIGLARDNAGNIARSSVTVSVDRSAPVVTATVAGTPNADGWFTGPATIHFACTDAASGVADCPADTVLATEGAAQTVIGTAHDRAGNTGTGEISVQIDLTAPVLTASASAEPNANGWYKTPPTIRFACTDAVSGVATCAESRTVETDGAGQRIAGSGTDKAGNTGSTALTVNLDRAAPSITATVVGGTRKANGWYTTAPTIRFVCADADSGVGECPADLPVAAEGANQLVSGTATDRAGNTATGATSVSVDRTAPAVTVAGAANGAAFTPDAKPKLSCQTTDAASGVATPASLTQVYSGKFTYTVTCAGAVDKAGNAAATVKITYVVAPTVEWLTALTHKVMPNAPAATWRDLDAALKAHNLVAYVARVGVEAAARKPVVSQGDAVTLVYWAAMLGQTFTR